MENRTWIWPLVVGVAVASAGAYALEMRASGDLSLEHTDNARKSSGKEISEAQQRLGLSIAGEHGGDELTASFQYSADHRFFNEDSQRERTSLEGMGALRWEQIANSLFWDLSHRRKDVLQDNALADIRENRDERDITEISPLYIVRLTPADVLQTRLQYSNVVYRRADDLDSSRYGGSVGWRRLISPTTNLLVTAQTSEVDFESDLQDDYRQDSLSANYAVGLARLNYSVTLGVTKATRDRGDDMTGPLIGVAAEYNDGVRQWYARFDSRITDSSIGDGNRDIFDSVDASDTTLGVVDVIQKTDMEVGVSSQLICQACEVRGLVFFDREEYDTQPRDNDEYGAQASLLYRLSSVSSLMGTYRIRSVAYGGNNDRTDYDQNEFLVEYTRRVFPDLTASAFVGYSDRSAASSSGLGSQNYDETRFGLQLSYQFF